MEIHQQAAELPLVKLSRGRSWRSCFLSSFFEFCSAVLEEKSKISQPIAVRGFPMGPKKHKLGRERCDLVSCQVSFKMCHLGIKGRGGHFVFPIGPVSGFIGEVENVLISQSKSRAAIFSRYMHLNSKLLQKCSNLPKWNSRVRSHLTPVLRKIHFQTFTIVSDRSCTVIFAREMTPLQWRQHGQWPKVDVTLSARQFPRKYDGNMAVCVHCIRPIYRYICLEAFLESNETQRRNRCVINYDSALLTSKYYTF